MGQRRILATVVAAICSAALPLSAQAQFDEDYVVPRTSYGDPDLQGFWSNAVLTPLERPADLADKATLTPEEAEEYAERRRNAINRDRRTDDADADVANAYNDFWWDTGENIVRTRRTSLIIDPPNGRLPALTPAAQQRRASRVVKEFPEGPEDLGLTPRCIYFTAAGPPMLPSPYNNNYHLVQTEDYVLIVNEMVHETRIIPLEGRAKSAEPPAGVSQYRGISRGRWEGDTLVVETTNRRDDTSLFGSGPNMRLTERFTRAADDVLLYEFTVEDPENFTQPWTAQIPSVKADGIMYEYACHEGNRGMYGMLSGARAAEQAQQ